MTYEPDNILLSVIIPTYNPDYNRLTRTLSSLDQQSLDKACWELLIVDNNSSNDVLSRIQLGWHSSAKIIKEPKQGLTFARLAGFNLAFGEIIIMVDDDNELETDYLANAFEIMTANLQLGAVGGKIKGFYEIDPPYFINEISKLLAIVDHGNEIWQSSSIQESNFLYPDKAPVGAGMVLRKDAITQYCNKIKERGSIIPDRKGGGLSSGGDNDIVINILKEGYLVGYFPQLKLNHIIPSCRLKIDYLARLNQESSRSWSQLLLSHKISPWNAIPKWTLALRKIKAYFKYQPWKSPLHFIQWKGACGHFEGRVYSRDKPIGSPISFDH